MPSWSNLAQALEALPIDQRGPFVTNGARQALSQIASITGRNAIVYASSWLQKPQVPGIYSAINHEDVNGFMTCLHGMDCTSGLTLILHTPGGLGEAAETIVDYLWSKFAFVEAIIPTYAMSAGTMIALASHQIIMGRQSQLGPTDPQLLMNDRQFSAHSIVDQFDEAKREITADPRLAMAWAPVLQPFGPALLQEARKAVDYGRGLVERWLAGRMFAGRADPSGEGTRVARFFSGSQHGSHGHRIGRVEARAQGVEVRDLETHLARLQDEVLTLYHYLTVIFENGPAAKLMLSTNGSIWIKNVQFVPMMPGVVPGPTPAPPAPPSTP
jgi:Serine dehydrogenase proteinase